MTQMLGNSELLKGSSSNLMMHGFGLPDTASMSQITETEPAIDLSALNTISTEDAGSAAEQSVGNEDQTRYVIVELNKNMYGISTDVTVELMDTSSTQITRVSHAPSYVQGVINHRGTIIPAIDMRSLLGFQSHSDGVKSLESMLAEREQDHVEWLNELKRCADTGEAFTKATDPSMCAFGKWYDNLRSNESLLLELTRGNTSAKALIDQFDAPHQAIHNIAKQVLQLVSEGRKEDAQSLIQETWDVELAHMRKLFSSLVETLRPVLSSMMVITEFEGKKLGLIVDAVHSVFDCDDAHIEALPDSTANAEFLQGLVHQPDGSYILISDIEQIYSKTKHE
jgi:chemotaxis signal transduction protein